MSKHLVGRQLPRPSFLPSRSLAKQMRRVSALREKREPATARQRRAVWVRQRGDNNNNNKKIMTHAPTHLLQRALYVRLGHAVRPRLFDDVEKRDVLLWINRPAI